jgi:hypothetical protein
VPLGYPAVTVEGRGRDAQILNVQLLCHAGDVPASQIANRLGCQPTNRLGHAHPVRGKNQPAEVTALTARARGGRRRRSCEGHVKSWA